METPGPSDLVTMLGELPQGLVIQAIDKSKENGDRWCGQILSHWILGGVESPWNLFAS